jgi:D-galactose 1-dehydrogenase
MADASVNWSACRCCINLIYSIIKQTVIFNPDTPIKQTINIAVIGVGKIARDQHFPAIAANSQFNLSATVSSHAGTAGVPNFDSIEALIDSGIAITAVAVCTPPQVRGEIACKAIAAGYAVMLEKPPAATLAEFADIRRRARERGVSLFATWHSRHAAMVPAARNWLADRTVIAGRVTWCEDVRRWHPGQNWLWAPGGLGVFDPGINAFSILTEILPQQPVVVGVMLDIPANAHTPIAARLKLKTGEADLTVELDFLQAGPQSWEIELDTVCGQRLCLFDGGSQLSINGGPTQTGNNDEYPSLYARFAELIALNQIEADEAPLRLVADAMLIGQIRRVEAFIE